MASEMEQVLQVLQGMQQQLNDQGRAIQEMQVRFDGIDQRFDKQDQRFDGLQAEIQDVKTGLQAEMKSGFEKSDKRFDETDKRFDNVEAQVSNVESQVSNVQGTLVRLETEYGKQINALHDGFILNEDSDKRITTNYVELCEKVEQHDLAIRALASGHKF